MKEGIVMLIIGILMVLGSIAWAAWDLRRKAKQRRREMDAWIARMEEAHRSSGENSTEGEQ